MIFGNFILGRLGFNQTYVRYAHIGKCGVVLPSLIKSESFDTATITTQTERETHIVNEMIISFHACFALLYVQVSAVLFCIL